MSQTPDSQKVVNKIYVIRGQRVMLDSDLAEMYGVETRVLNQAVKRNIGRFPEDFMFKLTKKEFDDLKSRILEAYLSDDEDSAVLKSQIVISKLGDGRGGTRKLPYAFTEQGVSMLSSVLRSETAIQVNIAIMRVFVAARQAIAKPQQRSIEERMKSLEDTLEEIVADQNDINEDTRMQLELINEVLAQLQAEAPKREHKETGYLAVKKEQNQ